MLGLRWSGHNSDDIVINIRPVVDSAFRFFSTTFLIIFSYSCHPIWQCSRKDKKTWPANSDIIGDSKRFFSYSNTSKFSISVIISLSFRERSFITSRAFFRHFLHPPPPCHAPSRYCLTSRPPSSMSRHYFFFNYHVFLSH